MKFEEWWEEVHRAGMGYALRLTRNYDDAQDLLQESCILALRAFDPSKDPGPAWLKRIIFHRFIDRRRADARRPACCSFEGLRETNEHFDVVDDRQSLALADVASDISSTLRRAMKRLTADQQNVVAAIAQGIGPTEYAQATGLPVTAVRTRYMRARQRMAALLTTAANGG